MRRFYGTGHPLLVPEHDCAGGLWVDETFSGSPLRVMHSICTGAVSQSSPHHHTLTDVRGCGRTWESQLLGSRGGDFAQYRQLQLGLMLQGPLICCYRTHDREGFDAVNLFLRGLQEKDLRGVIVVVVALCPRSRNRVVSVEEGLDLAREFRGSFCEIAPVSLRGFYADYYAKETCPTCKGEQPEGPLEELACELVALSALSQEQCADLKAHAPVADPDKKKCSVM